MTLYQGALSKVAAYGNSLGLLDTTLDLWQLEARGDSGNPLGLS